MTQDDELRVRLLEISDMLLDLDEKEWEFLQAVNKRRAVLRKEQAEVNRKRVEIA
jgi:hypothetical protein